MQLKFHQKRRSTYRLASVVFVLAASSVSAAGSDPDVHLTVTNPTSFDWIDAPVVTDAGSLWHRTDVPDANQAWVLAGPQQIPLQREDFDHDSVTDQIAFLVTLHAGESRSFKLKHEDGKTLAKRAHALMSLKGFDGVGWESDLIAYRIYWNLDNAMDVFGKNRPILSLDYWSRPGIAHNTESQYGIDVLKVGRALGLGGFGIWRDGRVHKVTNVMKDYHIRADGPIRAVVDLEYVHWIVGQVDPDLKPPAGAKLDTYDMIVRMSIFAGQKWGECEITIKPEGDSPMPELVTAIPIHEETELIEDRTVGIVGRWGRQALGDKEVPKAADLGMGIIVDPQQAVDYGSDGINQYVRLKPQNGKVSYRYHASWSKEPGGAHSAKEYEAMLRQVATLRPKVAVTAQRD